MKGNPEERAVDLGLYIVENNATIRTAAKEFGIGKSTVHKDISARLLRINPILYASVKAVLDQNTAERAYSRRDSHQRKISGLEGLVLKIALIFAAAALVPAVIYMSSILSWKVIQKYTPSEIVVGQVRWIQKTKVVS